MILETNTLIGGRYRVTGVLGQGGMGGVFAAQDERLGRPVALKMLRPDLAADARARERFLREAMIAASIRHPNVVRTFDVGDAPQGAYLIQELLEGRTLSVEQLPPRRALAIVRDIASALQTIHEQGFVHCDVKPANIMLVDGETRAVLLDFGIARDAGADASSLIATPLYLAPERAFGAAPTTASDLYSLGIVLYVLLSGQPPFKGVNIHALLVQHQNEPLPPLALTDPSAKALEAIAVRLAAKQPTERYASAAELLDDLQRVEQGAMNDVPTLPMAQPASSAGGAAPLAAAPLAAAIPGAPARAAVVAAPLAAAVAPYAATLAAAMARSADAASRLAADVGPFAAALAAAMAQSAGTAASAAAVALKAATARLAAITQSALARASAALPAAGALKQQVRLWWALPLLVLLLLSGMALLRADRNAGSLKGAPLRFAPEASVSSIVVPASPAAAPTLVPTTAPQPTPLPPPPAPVVVAPAPTEEQAQPGNSGDNNGQGNNENRGEDDEDEDEDDD